MIRYIIPTLLALLPWSALLFPKLNIWTGQGHFFQIGLLVIFSLSFFEKKRLEPISNKSLGLFTLWLGILTCYLWARNLELTNKYPVLIFMPFFNYLCFVLFYKLSCEYLVKKDIERTLKWLSYSVFLVLIYCVLQKLNLDQFYNGFGTGVGIRRAELVGTIGNPSHLGGYLALCQPLYFDKGLFNKIALVLLWVIILMTQSASGLLVAVVILFYHLIATKKWKCLAGLVLAGVIGGVVLSSKLHGFFGFSHRLEIWQVLFDIFKQKPITGQGLGILNAIKPSVEGIVSVWRHAHCEPYQLAIEAGVIGLGLLIYGIYSWFLSLNSVDVLSIRISAIFIGFIVLSLMTFPAHLWLLASMGMIGYSFIYALKGEEKQWD